MNLSILLVQQAEFPRFCKHTNNHFSNIYQIVPKMPFPSERPLLKNSTTILTALLSRCFEGIVHSCNIDTFYQEFIGGGCDDPEEGTPLLYVSKYIKNGNLVPYAVYGEELDLSNMVTFPDRISQVYCYNTGCPDWETWILCCKLDCGMYILYTASCCYTGFNASGSMKIIVSKSLPALIQFGMTDPQRLILFEKQQLLDKN